MNRNVPNTEGELITHPPARSAGRKTTILCLGNDDILLRTRLMVLESNDYAVQLVHPAELLTPGNTFYFDLAIICHSLRGEEKRRVVHKLQKDYPGALILLLNGPEYDPLPISLPLSEDIASFSTIFSGPQALLSRVEGLINGKAGGKVAGKIGAGRHH